MQKEIRMPSFIYKKRFYGNFFIRKAISLSIKITELFDDRKDRKICGCSLVKYVPSLYRESMGATGSHSTCYWTLDKVLKDAAFDSSDAFIDVGCGKGRVLAYMIGKGYSFSLTGVELNADVAAYAQNWAKQYDNVKIISGSAFDLDYNEYTVLYLGRPFEPETFYQFIRKIESELIHPIRLYYCYDQQSGDFLNDREGWTMLNREKIFTSHGLFMFHNPQRYSIWIYTPHET